MYLLYMFVSSLFQSIHYGIASDTIVEEASNYTLCPTSGTITVQRGTCYYSCSRSLKSFTSGSDENFICEDDGITPLSCNSTGKCPLGTCEMVVCENETGPSRCYKRKTYRTRLCVAQLEKIKTVINYTLRMKASSSFTKRSFTLVDAILFAAAIVMAILLRYTIKRCNKKSSSTLSVLSGESNSNVTGGYHLIPRHTDSSEPPSYSTVVRSTDTSRETPPPTYTDVMNVLNSKAAQV